MTEQVHPDKITLRHVEEGADGPKVVSEVPIIETVPKGIAGLRRKGLPEGVNTLDMRNLTAKEVPHVIIEGEAVGGVVQVHTERGYGVQEVQPGVEVVVYLGRRHQDIIRETSARAPKPLRTKGKGW